MNKKDRPKAILSIFFTDPAENCTPETDVITSRWVIDKLEAIFEHEIGEKECLILSIRRNETDIFKRKRGDYEVPLDTIPLGYGSGKRGSVLSQSIQNLTELPAYCYSAISGNKKDFRKTSEYLLKAMNKQKIRMMDDGFPMEDILRLERKIERTEKALTLSDADLMAIVGQVMIEIPKNREVFKRIQDLRGGLSSDDSI